MVVLSDFTHSLELTHSLTRSLTHSLTHLLTYSLPCPSSHPPHPPLSPRSCLIPPRHDMAWHGMALQYAMTWYGITSFHAMACSDLLHNTLRQRPRLRFAFAKTQHLARLQLPLLIVVVLLVQRAPYQETSVTYQARLPLLPTQHRHRHRHQHRASTAATATAPNAALWVRVETRVTTRSGAATRTLPRPVLPLVRRTHASHAHCIMHGVFMCFIIFFFVVVFV